MHLDSDSTKALRSGTRTTSHRGTEQEGTRVIGEKGAECGTAQPIIIHRSLERREGGCRRTSYISMPFPSAAFESPALTAQTRLSRRPPSPASHIQSRSQSPNPPPPLSLPSPPPHRPRQDPMLLCKAAAVCSGIANTSPPHRIASPLEAPSQIPPPQHASHKAIVWRSHARQSGFFHR